jgi:hypothetical protein
MKLEMAVLYSDGSSQGSWKTVIVEVPEAYRGLPYYELDMIGRDRIFTDDTFSECAGTYLFNERADEMEKE